MMIAQPVVDVCARCSVATLRSAVDSARPGTVIRVHARQRGGVIIRVPLTMLGGGNELVGDDGAETGIDVQAPGVRIADLTIRGFATDDASGRSAAIVLDSSGTRVDNVSFLDNRFALS